MASITRRKFINTVGAAAAVRSATGHAMTQQATSRHPNILFILTDNYDPHVAGYARHPLVQTPNLDRLARQGVQFTNCYCGSPLCAPARASLMTGMFPSDVDAWGNATVFQGQVPTWGAMMREAGYYSAAYGKMDLSDKMNGDFDEAVISNSHETNPDITELFRRPMCYRIDERPMIDKKLIEGEHHDEAILRRSLTFLRDKAPKLEKPWILYVGYVGPLPGFEVEQRYFNTYPEEQIRLPHVPAEYLETMPAPWQVTRAYKQIAVPIPEQRIRAALSAYYGNVTAMDHRVGQLLDELEKSGRSKDTIVIFTVDHGRSLGEHGLWYHNEPTDHSARTLLTMAGPGIPTGGKVSTPVMHVDFSPTLLELAGAPVPTGLRGHSLLPLCHGQTGGHPGIAYSELHAEGACTGSFTIRKGPWKYIHYSYYDDLLFHMEEDPGEMKNVIGTPEGQRVQRELYDVLRSLIGDPEAMTERAFHRQEQMLQDMCNRMSLEELLAFGFERRLGRGQAITLLKRYKR